MTLRPRALEARLRRLKEVARRLRRYRERGVEALARDEDLPWLVERGLQLGCEIVLDSANHIVAGGFGRTVETYEQMLDVLAVEAVIGADLRADSAGPVASETCSCTTTSRSIRRGSSWPWRGPRSNSTALRARCILAGAAHVAPAACFAIAADADTWVGLGISGRANRRRYVAA